MLVSAAASAAAVLVLLAVIVEDLRRFRIRNGLVLILLGCFGLDAAFGARVEAPLAHMAFGGGFFLLLLALFARGWIGGGDAKLLSVALLWAGPAEAVPFSLLLMLATLGYALGARLGWLPARYEAGRREIPFGPSIAAAWIVVVLFQYLNSLNMQFH